jgi:hypothetical protein
MHIETDGGKGLRLILDLSPSTSKEHAVPPSTSKDHAVPCDLKSSAVKGDKRDPHLCTSGKGGKHGDDYRMQAAVLMQGGLTRQAAMEHLEAQQGEAQHPLPSWQGPPAGGPQRHRKRRLPRGSASTCAWIPSVSRHFRTQELLPSSEGHKHVVADLHDAVSRHSRVRWHGQARKSPRGVARAGKGKVLRNFMRFQI